MNCLHNLSIDQLMNKLLYLDYYYWQTEPGRNFRLTVGYKF